MIRSIRILFAVLACAAGTALAAPAAKAVEDSQVLFPGGTPSTEAPVTKTGGGTGITTVLGVLVLAGVGGWMFWRGRKVNMGGRGPRLLSIDETRPLGNRQYLVVASYEGKKLLLGVCPGRIDLLAPLNSPGAKEDLK